MQNTSRVLLWIVLIFGVLVLIALWGGSFASPDSSALPVNENNIEEEVVVNDNQATIAAKNELASSLEVDESEVEIISVEDSEWPNSCLGLESQDEMCAQVIVPGYLVTLEVNGEEYRFRTDKEGSILKQEVNE